MSDTPKPTNGYDGKRALEVIDAIESLKAERRRIKEKAAAEIAPKIGAIDADIGKKLKEAKTAWGIPIHILKAQLTVRDFDRKKNEKIEALDEDDQELLQRLRGDIGPSADLPLFSALLIASGDGEAAAPEPEQTKARRTRRAAQNADIDAIGSTH